MEMDRRTTSQFKNLHHRSPSYSPDGDVAEVDEREGGVRVSEFESGSLLDCSDHSGEEGRVKVKNRVIESDTEVDTDLEEDYDRRRKRSEKLDMVDLREGDYYDRKGRSRRKSKKLDTDTGTDTDLDSHRNRRRKNSKKLSTDTDTNTEDEDCDRKRRKLSSRKKEKLKSRSGRKRKSSSGKKRRRSDESESEEKRKRKKKKKNDKKYNDFKHTLVLEKQVEEPLVGPMPLPKPKEGNISYGQAMRPGEGNAMAQYVKQDKRIPRRGEVGHTEEEIKRLEAAGYQMSGDRHKRMTSVRLRKEHQVYSAEEMKALATFNYEQRQERERKTMSNFKKIVTQTIGDDH